MKYVGEKWFRTSVVYVVSMHFVILQEIARKMHEQESRRGPRTSHDADLVRCSHNFSRQYLRSGHSWLNK